MNRLKQENPEAEVEVWFFDVSKASQRVHRVGLKPILSKVWSPKGERPIGSVNHRYEWLYVYGFVNPKTGETHWYLIPRVNVLWFNLVLATFAVEVGASQGKRILLVEDRAGWHRSKQICLPSGITTEYLPAYSPELQPAERLWKLVDKHLVNEHFETLDELEEVLVKRCHVLSDKMQSEIKNLTNYHWLEYA